MPIHEQILDFIKHPEPARFERLAREVFAYQFERVPAYREFCQGHGVSPGSIDSVAEIPPVSTAAFKYVALRGGPPQRIFLTSGTTRGREERGRHFVTNLEHYRASALEHLRRMLFPDRRRLWMLALHPTADRMPESSLSQMITWCIETFGAGRAVCCANPDRVDSQAACDFLRAAELATEPVCLLGTTAAFSTLFEHMRTQGIMLRLAQGSRLMDTGGPKGQARPLESHEVIAMARQYLAIEPELAINEYGMTELCSQLYDATPFNSPGIPSVFPRTKIAPPWLMVMARDPATMRPMAAGQTGMLSFFDLANAGSVSALFTEDLGSVGSDGTVHIFGRTAAGDPRGCALGIEQFAQRDVSAGIPAPPAMIPVSVRSGATTASRSVEDAAKALRLQVQSRLPTNRIVAAIAEACVRWRNPTFAARRAALAATAVATGQSEALLDASLDASLAGFTPDALADLAPRPASRHRLIGLIMAGNVIGAGLHEVCQALIGGAAVLVKAASAEPLFFAEFHRTLTAIDAEVAARMRVLIWSRLDRDATCAIAGVCDRLAAFGDDQTMAEIGALAGTRLVDFGSRMSGAMLAAEAMFRPDAQALADNLARDVCLFDQRGCLSLHHLFIEGQSPRDAQSFAQSLARAIDELSRRLPPPSPLPAADAVAARVARENARWRRIGGAPVGLWEGEDMAWTVIFDAEADFGVSPLCRTLRVSTFAGPDDLRRRLDAAVGRLEGFVVADPAHRLDREREILREMGVCYLCRPGFLQSPPPSWPHGGGRFLQLMMSDDG